MQSPKVTQSQTVTEELVSSSSSYYEVVEEIVSCSEEEESIVSSPQEIPKSNKKINKLPYSLVQTPNSIRYKVFNIDDETPKEEIYKILEIPYKIDSTTGYDNIIILESNLNFHNHYLYLLGKYSYDEKLRDTIGLLFMKLFYSRYMIDAAYIMKHDIKPRIAREKRNEKKKELQKRKDEEKAAKDKLIQERRDKKKKETEERRSNLKLKVKEEKKESKYVYFLTFTIDPKKHDNQTDLSFQDTVEKYIIKRLSEDSFGQSKTLKLYYVKEHETTNVHWHFILKRSEPFPSQYIQYYRTNYGKCDLRRHQQISTELIDKYMSKENKITYVLDLPYYKNNQTCKYNNSEQLKFKN